jgi:hypothetical protein
MNYDLDFRYRRALQPDGLATIQTSTQAVADAMQDARNAGIHPEQDPAVVLLARHLGRVACGGDPAQMHDEDAPLRRRCLQKIDELRGKPALVALIRRGVSYDSEAKRAFHREARTTLKAAAREIGLGFGDYDLRNNHGGIAVSGEITLHSDSLYIQVGCSLMGTGREVMYRTCRDRRDYTGGRNFFCDVALLTDPVRFKRQLERDLGITCAAARQGELV